MQARSGKLGEQGRGTQFCEQAEGFTDAEQATFVTDGGIDGVPLGGRPTAPRNTASGAVLAGLHVAFGSAARPTRRWRAAEQGFRQGETSDRISFSHGAKLLHASEQYLGGQCRQPSTGSSLPCILQSLRLVKGMYERMSGKLTVRAKNGGPPRVCGSLSSGAPHSRQVSPGNGRTHPEGVLKKPRRRPAPYGSPGWNCRNAFNGFEQYFPARPRVKPFKGGRRTRACASGRMPRGGNRLFVSRKKIPAIPPARTEVQGERLESWPRPPAKQAAKASASLSPAASGPSRSRTASRQRRKHKPAQPIAEFCAHRSKKERSPSSSRRGAGYVFSRGLVPAGLLEHGARHFEMEPKPGNALNLNYTSRRQGTGPATTAEEREQASSTGGNVLPRPNAKRQQHTACPAGVPRSEDAAHRTCPSGIVGFPSKVEGLSSSPSHNAPPL